MLLLLIVLCPIAAAVLIMIDAPARATALFASIVTLLMTLLAGARFDAGSREFQYVISFPVSTDWGINFAAGLDGLSIVMVLLAAIVTVAAVWFTGKIDKYEHAFYACLFFISGGAIG